MEIPNMLNVQIPAKERTLKKVCITAVPNHHRLLLVHILCAQSSEMMRN